MSWTDDRNHSDRSDGCLVREVSGKWYCWNPTGVMEHVPGSRYRKELIKEDTREDAKTTMDTMYPLEANDEQKAS